MKTPSPASFRVTLITLFALGFGANQPAVAQTEPTLPVVTVHAPDASASEAGDPGRFVLVRKGPTNLPLNVYCVFAGTASNGVDHASIPHFIPIPAGVREVPVPVHPIDDNLAEGPETVVLRLAPSPLMSPVSYLIGSPSNAVVVIEDNDLPPPPPVVTIRASDPYAAEIPPVPPGMGMPDRIDSAEFVVTRTGSTDFALPVYYSVGGTAVNGVDYERLSGTVTIPAGAASASIEVIPIDDLLVEGTETVVLRIEPPACIAIFPPPRECYQVGLPREAVAFIADNDPSGNVLPEARITRPLDGQTFLSPANVPIRAETVDRDGYVDHVEFYAGTNLLGAETRAFLVPPPPGEPIVYEMVWTNPPVGRHVLRVKARDNTGGIGWSQPVTIWVGQTNLPPITNFPPIVTISAPDPIASEGTNCYQILIYPPPTNNPCPANKATFVVRRFGPTNEALTVHYRIGGTASNGVDYVELPGAVTIPPGRRAVEIRVVPIDDLVPECVETVVLSLVAPTDNMTVVPPYFVGEPRRAAAIIVDNDQPRPATGVLTDRCFHLSKPAANGTWWRIEVSTDLTHWTPLGTTSVTDGAIHFVDPDAEDMPARFYRAVPDANPTME